MNRDDPAHGLGPLVAHPCPSGRPDHAILEAPTDLLASLGLPSGTRLHLDRGREPRPGDLVLVDVVRRGTRERLLCRYDESDGTVTLSLPGQPRPAIMRWRSEIGVFGVVEPRDADCAWKPA